ncbi:RTA1 like protein-domain-containing protein, partial [Mycena albidolilacea]
ETGGLIYRCLSVLNPTATEYGTPSQLLILLAPIWVNAFLYMLMSRFVYFFVPDKRVAGISAQRLSLCFVLLDITSFLMQAAGGSMINPSSSAETQMRGIHIYMGGIGLQQFFILGFVGLVVRFHYKMLNLGGSEEWKRPLYAMYASLLLITIRIVYRLIEFSSGIYSPLTVHEAPFYCLEATPMFFALLLWNLYHPGQILVGPDSDFPKKGKKEKDFLPLVPAYSPGQYQSYEDRFDHSQVVAGPEETGEREGSLDAHSSILPGQIKSV